MLVLAILKYIDHSKKNIPQHFSPKKNAYIKRHQVASCADETNMLLTEQ